MSSTAESHAIVQRDRGVTEPCRAYIPLFRCIIGKFECSEIVQSHVDVSTRNNGFLRYWTLSNLPLFILGAPMFTIMAASGLWALRDSPLSRENDVSKVIDQAESQRYQVLCNLAATQLLFTVYTLTTAHAQIITRISSASPVWMWFLAVACSEDKPIAKYFVRFSVIYAMVQGGLFASFLPPA